VAKLDDEIKNIKETVSGLEAKLDKLQFFLIQIMNKLNEGTDASGGGAASPIAATQGAISVDITPLEEKLDELSKTMVSKADLEPLSNNIAKLHDDRLKEAEETVDNVTVLLEKGLALTELAASLKEIETHLQELITPKK